MQEDDPLIGALIGDRYRLIHPVGRGGMGVVYRAEDAKLEGRPCAVKLLLGNSMDPEEAGRFEREVRIIARLRSAHVVQILDTGRLDDGRRYIVMELLEGQPLSALLKRGGPMVPARAIRIARGVLAGLAEAHEYGVVHRDLKPANVFVTRARTGDEIAKVLDFGIAKDTRQRAGEELTAASMVVGTPKYMAPEQFLKRPADARTDLYAVGLLLYQMLAGEPPFHGETPVPPSVGNMGADFRVGWLHVNETPRPLQVGAELWAVLDRLLSKEPARRYADAQSVIDALSPSVSGLVSYGGYGGHGGEGDPTGPSGISSTTGFPIAGELSLRAREPRRFRGRLWAGLLAGLLAVGAGATWWLTPSLTPRPTTAAGLGLCELSLRTVPPGAVVTMGAEVKGATPLTLIRPCRETWRVKLEKKGYRDRYEVISGRAGRQELSVTLKPEARAPAPPRPKEVEVATPPTKPAPRSAASHRRHAAKRGRRLAHPTKPPPERRRAPRRRPAPAAKPKSTSPLPF